MRWGCLCTYAGRIVESGTTEQILINPKHPYTIGLLKSVPKLEGSTEDELVPIIGAPPVLSRLPDYCAFCPRCASACDSCREKPIPELIEVEPGHFAACHCIEEVERHG